MKRIIAILIIGLLVNGASVEKSKTKTLYPYSPSPEFQTIEFKEYPLQITCPICGYIYYYVTIPEIYDGDKPETDWFIPANSNVKPYEPFVPWEPCPNDGALPSLNYRDPRFPNEVFGKIHTNKGWMPKGPRPNR